MMVASRHDIGTNMSSLRRVSDSLESFDLVLEEGSNSGTTTKQNGASVGPLPQLRSVEFAKIDEHDCHVKPGGTFVVHTRREIDAEKASVQSEGICLIAAEEGATEGSQNKETNEIMRKFEQKIMEKDGDTVRLPSVSSYNNQPEQEEEEHFDDFCLENRRFRRKSKLESTRLCNSDSTKDLPCFIVTSDDTKGSACDELTVGEPKDRHNGSIDSIRNSRNYNEVAVATGPSLFQTVTFYLFT